jgi:hypothetical protein
MEANTKLPSISLDLISLWRDKYTNSPGIFSSKVEDFQVKWVKYGSQDSEIMLRHNPTFSKNVSEDVSSE